MIQYPYGVSRLAFRTAWSSNSSSICDACGIKSVGRIERSKRYLVQTSSTSSGEETAAFVSSLYDHMTGPTLLLNLLNLLK